MYVVSFQYWAPGVNGWLALMALPYEEQVEHINLLLRLLPNGRFQVPDME